MKRQLILLAVVLSIIGIVGYLASRYNPANDAVTLDGIYVGCSQEETRELLGQEYEVVNYDGINSMDDGRVGWRFATGTLVDFVGGKAVYIEGKKLSVYGRTLSGQSIDSATEVLGLPLEDSGDQIVYDFHNSRLFISKSGQKVTNMSLETKP